MIASFGTANVFVFDMLRQHVSGTVTEQIAADNAFWRERMLPIMIGLMGASIGVLPVHCASFAFGGDGVLIAGPSGAGKSTLSAELCIAGREVEYMADDWTYVTLQQHQLTAHGAGARIKLLPDAVRHFKKLSAEKPRISMNGELAYELHPATSFCARVRYQCKPRWLFFLERSTAGGVSFTPLTPDYAREYLHHNVERLPMQLWEAGLRRTHVMNAVTDLPAWKMRCGGSPADTATQLRQFITTLQKA